MPMACRAKPLKAGPAAVVSPWAEAERLSTDKGEWLLYRAQVTGESAQALLPAMIATSLAKLPIPKLMRWGASDVQFVRPVHTVTLLLGDELIPAKILGIDSARTLRGHRFMGEPEFTIDSADQYPQIMVERGKVQPDFEVRKALIKAGAEEAAAKIGGMADLSESLLEEVTSLVEWPVVLTAKFEEKFLAVPAEALVYTMKGDQKYFPVYDKAGNLLPNFIFVTNIESKDPQQIISGNEKVSAHASPTPSSSSTVTVSAVWKITCRVWKPCCSRKNWAPCVTRPTVFRRWLAGLLRRLGPM